MVVRGPLVKKALNLLEITPLYIGFSFPKFKLKTKIWQYF
jgi:hypothetical protein